MKKPVFIMTMFILTLGGGQDKAAVYGQSIQPIFLAEFNESTFQESGWQAVPSGSGSFDPAQISIGLIPSAPNYSNGRGIVMTALSGQGSFVTGPVVNVGDDLVFIRFSVVALAGGGTIAVGALNANPTNGGAVADGSLGYAYEVETGNFVDSYDYVQVVYRPKGKSIIPFFQLAVLPSDQQKSVTVFFDNFEIIPLNEQTVADPVLRAAMGIGGSSSEPSPTPTMGSFTPTPTQTPTGIINTPTPPPAGAVIEVDEIFGLSPSNDQREAYAPNVDFDQGETFSVVATDLTEGFQDVLMRTINVGNQTVDGPFLVNQTFQDTVTDSPDIKIDFSGTRHVVWTDNRAVEKLFSIYLTQLNPAGERMVENDFEVNNLFESTNTAEPGLDVLDSGEIVIGWRDDRNFLMDFFVRRASWNGSRVNVVDDHDFQVNVPFENTNVSNPVIAITDDGTISAVWSDDRTLVNGKKRNDIFVRIFNFTTQPNSEHQLPSSAVEKQLSEQNSVLDQATNPDVAYRNGRFVAVWRNVNPSTAASNIHGVVFDREGAIVVSEFIVDSGEASSRALAPSIAAWSDDRFMISWFDEAKGQLMGRLYDAAKNLFVNEPSGGGPTLLLENIAGTDQTALALSRSSWGLLAWDGVINGFKDIFAASLALPFENQAAFSAPVALVNRNQNLILSNSTVDYQDLRETHQKRARNSVSISNSR